MFNICSDDKIPFAREAFVNVGNVTYRKGNRLTSADLKGVDVLLIRSGTKVDSSLLGGTSVKFVASATAGTDHVDENYLKTADIPFYHAPGCNAGSVVEYITAALFSMAERQNARLEGKCIGILGAGNVGGRLARRVEALGMKVIVCDPPLLESDPEAASRYVYVELDEMLKEADIISLHVPLTRDGNHPTFHLFDENRLLAMKQGAWLLNASRGAVISNEALKSVSRRGHLGAVVLDVWEGEPAIDAELLEMVDIGTAHIAGYSYEGKVNGTIMVYDAFMDHFGMNPTWDSEEILAPMPGDHLDVQLPSSVEN
ncbi:MAG: 4-phosphoerythronate dehydrogenase, partial [Rhodothermaceae bacterium]|nr:4-phosphoerythronate dehydrogenase [Rhodothermaceae bacterium]